jgi:hypothetical protein
MYRRAVFLSLLFFGIGFALFAFEFCYVRQSDHARYKAYVEKQELATTKDFASADQKRKGVRKDIYAIQEDKSRLHYRIESKASTLTLIPHNSKMEIVENLENIKCWMQEKLFAKNAAQGPMQQVRFLEADQGIYRYNTQQFIAEPVGLSLYRLPGHTLPSYVDEKSAFLRGVAQSASFAISGKNPQFQAQNFKAFLRKDGAVQ